MSQLRLCDLCKIFAHKNLVFPRTTLLEILSAKILSTPKHDLMTVINAILIYALEWDAITHKINLNFIRILFCFKTLLTSSIRKCGYLFNAIVWGSSFKNKNVFLFLTVCLKWLTQLQCKNRTFSINRKDYFKCL